MLKYIVLGKMLFILKCKCNQNVTTLQEKKTFLEKK